MSDLFKSIAENANQIAENANQIASGFETVSQIADDPTQIPAVKMAQGIQQDISKIQKDPSLWLIPKNQNDIPDIQNDMVNCVALQQKCENLEGSEYDMCMTSYKYLCE